MSAEYYADQYLRYATYVRNFGGNQIYKIACGPNRDDYHWTEVLMGRCTKRMNGLALHFYCGTGKNSRSATQFDEADWFHNLTTALRTEELVAKHSEIMDRFDPQKRIALIVDEWGAWHAVEPGTNKGFLYQQNSLRDALVAGLTLNIFNRHCDRVRMANIAQTINVLQAMILTDKEKMLLTPTYHVFEMYVPHHDATWLPDELTCADYAMGPDKIPSVNASASRDGSGKIHVTLCNLDPNRPAPIDCELRGTKASRISGRVLTAPEITAHNTFDQPSRVKPAPFEDAKPSEKGFSATLPPKSVVVIEIEPGRPPRNLLVARRSGVGTRRTPKACGRNPAASIDGDAVLPSCPVSRAALWSAVRPRTAFAPPIPSARRCHSTPRPRPAH